MGSDSLQNNATASTMCRQSTGPIFCAVEEGQRCRSTLLRQGSACLFTSDESIMAGISHLSRHLEHHYSNMRRDKWCLRESDLHQPATSREENRGRYGGLTAFDRFRERERERLCVCPQDRLVFNTYDSRSYLGCSWVEEHRREIVKYSRRRSRRLEMGPILCQAF
jgi:hypothetical protein